MKAVKGFILFLSIAASLLGSAFLLWNKNLSVETLQRVVPGVALQNMLVLIQNFLPWLGLLSIIFILLTIAFKRYKIAVLLLVYPAVSAYMFLPQLFPVKSDSAPNAITIATANIDADNPTPQEAVKNIIAQKADLVGIEEVQGSAGDQIIATMNQAYPYNHVYGTVGLWSKYPISEGEAADMPTNGGRVLTSEVDLPQGKTQVYVSHMGSYRPYGHDQRDQMLEQVGNVMKTDPNDKAIIMGDFNASTYDSYFQDVLQANWPETQNDEFGMGFTWPSNFPATKIDHVFYKGFTNGTSHTFVATGSDHQGISAKIN